MERRSRKPPRLRKGQAIGIVAPAGPVSPSEIQPGIDLLEAAGYKVISSPHLYGTQGYVAGDDGIRLEDLHAMFSDGHVRAIFCARGGYGSLRLLEKMNFELIRRNPKILLGYSDITALLLAIYRETGLVTFHGAVVTELAKGKSVHEAQRITQQDVLDGLGGLPDESCHCALLAANTLKEAMKDYLVSKNEPWKRAYRESPKG